MQTTAFLPQVTRMSLSISLGAIMTGVLLIIMCALIAMEPSEIEEFSPNKFTVVMDPAKQIEPIVEKISPKPIEAVSPPITPLVTPRFENPSPNGNLTLLDPPVITDPTAIQGPDSGTATTLFAVAPAYPDRALRLGIEGYVDLLFDITATGKTENIRILHAQPAGYFEKISVKTLKKWKYKPAIEDGLAIAQKNKSTRITFELDK